MSINEALQPISARLVMIMICTVLVASCYSSEYVDVSNEGKYRELVGSKFVTRSKLVMHGVRREDDSNTADYFVITPPPGFSGPEVVNHADVLPNTAFIVDAITRCTNCVPESEEVVIRISPDSKGSNRQLTLRNLGGIPVLMELSGRVRLNPDLFSELPEANN